MLKPQAKLPVIIGCGKCGVKEIPIPEDPCDHILCPNCGADLEWRIELNTAIKKAKGKKVNKAIKDAFSQGLDGCEDIRFE